MKENPKAALDALTTPSALTLGKIALLCRLEAPILAGRIDDLNETLAALYVIETPLERSVSEFARIRDVALVRYDSLTPDEYRAKVGVALDAVAAFWEMMPRPSPDSKKNSETDGAPSSPSGSAEPTTTKSTTCSGNCRLSRPRFSGDAGSRGREETRRARS